MMSSSQPHKPPAIGIIGLGLMGRALAVRLFQSGFMVHGFDTDASCSAAFIKLGGELADNADAVLGLNSASLAEGLALAGALDIDLERNAPRVAGEGGCFRLRRSEQQRHHQSDPRGIDSKRHIRIVITVRGSSLAFIDTTLKICRATKELSVLGRQLFQNILETLGRGKPFTG